MVRGIDALDRLRQVLITVKRRVFVRGQLVIGKITKPHLSVGFVGIVPEIGLGFGLGLAEDSVPTSALHVAA